MDRTRIGITLVLATALISGISVFLNGYAVKGFDSSVFTFSKNVLVALGLGAIVLATRRRHELTSLDANGWRQLVVIGLVGGSIPFLLFFHGLSLVSGTGAAFIHKTLFVFVAILAAIILKERISKPVMIGAVLILAGTALSLRSGLGFESAHLFVLAATLFWAAENVLSKRATSTMSGELVALGRMGFGALAIAGYLAVVGKLSIVWQMSPAQYGWIALTSVFLLGYVWTYYAGIARIRVSTAAALLALGAPITALLGVVAGTASFDPLGILALVLITAGATLYVLRETITPARVNT